MLNYFLKKNKLIGFNEIGKRFKSFKGRLEAISVEEPSPSTTS